MPYHEDCALIQAAGKAAGLVLLQVPNANQTDAAWWAYKAGDAPNTAKPWNPLEDDGDALRLAVDLAITIQFPWDDNLQFIRETHCWTARDFPEVESHKGNARAATRRAIVRAAAFGV